MSLLLGKILQSFDVEEAIKDYRSAIRFEASTQRLSEKEIRDLNKGADLSCIRGTVSVETFTDDSYIPIVHYCERNVSFGRFEREVINELPQDKWRLLRF